jgi:hypothetical protein
VSIDDASWEQSSLTVSRGGLGIRSARNLSIPAFLASIACIKDLVSSITGFYYLSTDPDCDIALANWITLTNSTQIPTSNLQRDCEAPILDTRSLILLQNFSATQGKARLLASAQKESEAWLNALQCASLDLTTDDSASRIAVGLRLGKTLCHPHNCVCSEPVDHLGTRCVLCQEIRNPAGTTWNLD